MGKKISLEEIDVRKYPAIHIVLPGFLVHYGWDDALQKIAISYPLDEGIEYVFIDADADKANEIIRSQLTEEIQALQDKGLQVNIEVLHNWLVYVGVATEGMVGDESSKPPRLGTGDGRNHRRLKSARRSAGRTASFRTSPRG